jgi:hypothetical protein
MKQLYVFPMKVFSPNLDPSESYWWRINVVAEDVKQAFREFKRIMCFNKDSKIAETLQVDVNKEIVPYAR